MTANLQFCRAARERIIRNTGRPVLIDPNLDQTPVPDQGPDLEADGMISR